MSNHEPMGIDVDHPLNQLLWKEFVEFAFGSPAFRAAFEKQTGLQFVPAPKNRVESAIDEACGVNQGGVINEFILWATEFLWGRECAPSKVREACEKRYPVKEGSHHA